MKILKIIFPTLILSFLLITSCKKASLKKDAEKNTIEAHGHSHDTNGNHIQEDKIEQEEFTVQTDTMNVKKNTEKHSHNSSLDSNTHEH